MSERSETPFSELLRPELAELSAYVPVQGAFRVRLDANEAPPLLSAEARTRLAEIAGQTPWERYPDARIAELRETIAAKTGVSPDEVLCGVGSDEIISMLLTALARHRGRGPGPTILTTTPTFVMYRMSGRVRGMNVVEVPLDAAWDLSEASMLRALQMSPPNVVFIASPNNPTGNVMSRERIERVIEATSDALVVLDEAYVDYASGDLLDYFRRYPHVAIMRTLSKVGFAALRVGWLIADAKLVREIDKVRLPYNMPTVSQRLAAAAIGELWDHVRELVDGVVSERERLSAELAKLPGVTLTPSQANFVWLGTERPAGEVFEGLAQRGVLTRSFHARGGRLAKQLRVTIGTREENDLFLAALREVL